MLRASGVSEVENLAFLHTKSAISFNILSVLQIFRQYDNYAFGILGAF